MTHGYIRIIADKQAVESQRSEIAKFCKKNEMTVSNWIEENISNSKEIDKRKLYDLLNVLKKGDILVCYELSGLGRNLLMIMYILNICMEKQVEVWTIKDNHRLGKDLNAKMLAFAFGLSAKIERSLISQRTKEAFTRMKAEGIHIGRPHGAESKEIKLTGKNPQIEDLIKQKMPKTKIAKQLGVHRSTLHRYLRKRNKANAD